MSVVNPEVNWRPNITHHKRVPQFRSSVVVGKQTGQRVYSREESVEVGEKLYQARMACNLSRAVVAETLGVTESSISQLEQGWKMFLDNYIKRLSIIYRVPAESLLPTPKVMEQAAAPSTLVEAELDGEMPATDTQVDPFTAEDEVALEAESLTALEDRLLAAFILLTPQEQAALTTLAEDLVVKEPLLPEVNATQYVA